MSLNADNANQGAEWEEIDSRSKLKIPAFPIDYKNFFNFTHCLLFIADKEGILLVASDSWEEITGYTAENLIGRNLHELICQTDKLNFTEAINGLSTEKNKAGIKCACVTRDLSLKYMEWNIMYFENNLYGSAKDISEYKDMTEQFYQLQDRFQIILDHIPQLVYWKDANLRYLGCNGSFAKVAGLNSPEEIFGKTDRELPWKNAAEAYINNDLELIAKNESMFNYEHKVQVPGSEFWIKANRILLHDKDNNIIGILGTSEDITEQKLEFNSLKESEMKFRSLFEQAIDAILVVDSDGEIVYINKSAVELFGYNELEEITPKRILDFIAEEDKAVVENNRLDRISGKESPNKYEVTGVKKDGTNFILNIHVSKFILKGKVHTLSFLRDVTERKKMETILQARESALSALFNSVTEFAMLLELDGKIKTANETAALICNSTMESLAGKYIDDVIDESFYGKNKKYFNEILTTKQTVRFEEIIGSKILDVTIYPVFNSEGEVTEFVIIMADITRYRNAIEELQKRDAMLSALINATTESAMLLDANGKILTANETVASRYHTSSKLFIGQFLYDLMPLEDAEVLKKHIDFVIEKGAPIRFELQRGGLFLDNSIYPVFNRNGKVVELAVFGADITKRKKAEEEIKKMNERLVESNSTKDKFFSIIAHDMKSPFQGLLGYSQILAEEYDDLSEEEKKLYINNIGEISRSTYKLLENLLQWSRMQTGNFEFSPEVLNLTEELESTLTLLRQTALNKNITIESFIRPKVYLMADKNMLNTIVRNLVSNSIKFTNTGGKISIFTSELNNYLIITIKDNGIGMCKEKLNCLFKPVKNISTLGTAKEKGTGLGLLLCKEMVEKHNGKIWVESEEGKGSSFHFSIPVRV
jgi:PAS domain S-box-containing protein